MLARIGRYRLLRSLGAGGMGEVFLAHDEQLERQVAIKGLTGAGDPPGRRERLRREALSVAALPHPAVAHVYEIVSEGERDFVVMEYVEGDTLSDLCSNGPLPPREVARIGAEIASALAAAHHAGIIHRDIKPENVMVTPAGHVKVLDFGLAKWTGRRAAAADEITTGGMVVGTSKAMSPEQATGREVDPRSDIFSLGSLLYEIATATPAFSGATPMETMVRVARAEHEPVDRRAALPRGLADVIERCLALHPEDRFASADDVEDTLRSVANASAVTALLPRSAAVSALGLAVRRRWPVLAAALLVLAALAAVAIVRGWLGTRAPLAVAVLPLEISAPGDEARLAAAATADAISVRLSQLDGLVVVSGRDVRALARAGKRATEIARELAVDQLVEASLSQHPGRAQARISLARIDGSSGRVAWSTQLELGTDDLLLLQDRIGTVLEDAFQGHSRLPGSEPTTNREALAAYLEVASRLEHGPRSRDLGEEIELLERAVEKAPRYLNAITRLVAFHRYRYDLTRDPEESRRAAEWLRRAEEIAPTSPRVLLFKSDFLIATDQVGEAERLARELVRRRPGDDAAWVQLGKTQRLLGRPDEAEKCLRRAVALRPSPSHLCELADVLAARRSWGEARNTLQALLERAPDNLEALGRLISLELNVGRFDAAEPAARRAVALRGAANDHSNLGTALFYLGHCEDAAACYREAVAKAPKQPVYLTNLADALYRCGKRGEAATAYASSLALCDEMVAATGATARLDRSRAISLAHLGRGPEAVRAAQAAWEQEPDDAWTATVVALVAALNGERQAALAWTQRARELGALTEWFSGPEFEELRANPSFVALVGAR